MKHPIQPIEIDEHGRHRFKMNNIVNFLLENGPHDLNTLRARLFCDEDWEQFAQLIGYSLSGFSELSFVSNETYAAAEAMVERGLTEHEARIASLEAVLTKVREGIKIIAPQVFKIHPNDLES